MNQPNENQILAASSMWVSAVLNFFPGLGSGYLYQRRWKAYWLTTLSSIFWLIIGFYNQLAIDPSDPAPIQADQNGILGLFFIALFTAIESVWAIKRAREAIIEKE
tara:strand:- start:20840 stop:21157 length:318 start_codon:yes stop_codon:yes gene_type:complete